MDRRARRRCRPPRPIRLQETMQRKAFVKSEDNSNIKTDTYVLKAADPFFDCDEGGIKINHILKFHPSDKDALEEYGHEWILRRGQMRTTSVIPDICTSTSSPVVSTWLIDPALFNY